MPRPNDLSRSLVALDQDSTIIAVVEMSQSSWLVGGVLPGIERQPCKKLEPSAERLLGTTASGSFSRPILQVPSGWRTVIAVARMWASISASDRQSGPGMISPAANEARVGCRPI